jgi:hypothetical protein
MLVLFRIPSFNDDTLSRRMIIWDDQSSRVPGTLLTSTTVGWLTIQSSERNRNYIAGRRDMTLPAGRVPYGMGYEITFGTVQQR